ncbi:MAG: SufD family Fe-S cluster assembly protein [Syntrophomonadaceae bacterium]|nr:SufD family Fe-S cluster assembly protein [Syntrophomonadaceae bacterium]MDD3888433.1 SufD family Fe-S cluster assembly protein [Syntrophomonadaceae bacterium]MDD4549185.1 SufD family Fe-S cluster assembly protein [Syntrophomonadaceae bacterium]
MKINQLDMQLLNTISNLNGVPDGAVNIRLDGKAVLRNSTPNIKISSKENGSGLVVEVRPGTRNETVHVPVLLTSGGFVDKVYNTFIVGEDSDVTIIAGCGIHNDSHSNSRHDGIHEIVVKKGARLKYIEKHYGEGSGDGKRILNPTTTVTVEKGAFAEMEMVQIKGVDDTYRSTVATIHEKGSLKIVERLMTHGCQSAESDISVCIEGKDGSGQVLSRSVAKDESYQVFKAALTGKTECIGHVECDSIIMDNARIKAIPQLVAEDSGAILTHEAAIGKIAGEQLIKLMSLGLTEKEAVETILAGFLR